MRSEEDGPPSAARVRGSQNEASSRRVGTGVGASGEIAEELQTTVLRSGSTYTAGTDIPIYDQMKIDYASRL